MSKKDDIERVRQFLDRSWNIRIRSVLQDERLTDDEWWRYNSRKIVELVPTDQDTLVKWLYRQDDIHYKDELATAEYTLKVKYAELRNRNTKVEMTLLKTKIRDVRDHSYFTWGEGTKEFQTWAVEEEWKKETWYKGRTSAARLNIRSEREGTEVMAVKVVFA